MMGAVICIGEIVKPFGIKGEVKLVPSDDFWENVLDSHELILAKPGEEEERSISIDGVRKHGGAYLIKLEGIADRNDAQTVVGSRMLIPVDKIDVDMPEEALPCQIIGCRVVTEEGVEVGVVTGLLFSSAHDIYEVTGERGVSLIPAVPEFIREMDIEEGRIVVKPIPGLLAE
jgi:16S rRNA processing protein RimM